MEEKSSGNWWTRQFWVIVLLPVVAAGALAVVGVFKGWLHRKAGFDDTGRTLGDPPEKEKARPRPVVPTLAAYQQMAADLKRQGAERSPRIRYLSLVHRYNDPGCTDADLEEERRAVRGMVGLLSTGKSELLDFIDPDHLLFRIDLEALGWDADSDWHKVVAQYRYGLGPLGDDALARQQREVERMSKAEVPVVRGDWFVVALGRPPLAGTTGLMRKSASDLPEPIRNVARRYSAQTLDLAACARELDSTDKALKELIRKQANLQEEFALAPLLHGESIRREWWESDRNFFSPYQEVARLLKRGKPVRVQ